MLVWSAWLLGAGVLLGLVLVILSQTVTPGRQPWWPGALHAGLGLAAFVFLLVGGLDASPREVQQGTASFGIIAAWLLAAALCLGSILAIGRMRRRPPSMLVIGIHATFGVAGLVLLATYLSA